MDNKELSKHVWNTIQDDLKNRVSQYTTHDKIDKLFKKYCTKQQYNQLQYRRDNRNWGKFFLDIKKGTDDELSILKKWKNDMKERGVKVTGKNNGIDNTGLPVIYATKLGRPDYKISLNDKASFLLDVKNNPKTDKYMTFKVSDLERYSSKGSFVLSCMPSTWVIIGPNFMKGLLVDWKREIFPRFAPTKEAIRISQEQYEKLKEMSCLTSRNWGDKKKINKLTDKKITFADFNK